MLRAHRHLHMCEFLSVSVHVMKSDLVVNSKSSEKCWWFLLLLFSACISEPTSANPPSEVSSPGSGPADTFSRPSDSALAAGLRTPEPEARRDGEMAAAPEHETEEEKALRLLYCSLCKVAVNSASQLHAHNRGEDLNALPQSSSAGPAPRFLGLR